MHPISKGNREKLKKTVLKPKKPKFNYGNDFLLKKIKKGSFPKEMRPTSMNPHLHSKGENLLSSVNCFNVHDNYFVGEIYRKMMKSSINGFLTFTYIIIYVFINPENF